MDAKTLEALKASIAKWEKNAVAKTTGDYLKSVKDCPLCGLFYAKDCDGCPISEKTGQTVCEGTPYAEAAEAWSDWDWWTVIDGKARAKSRAKALRAAKAEVKFLKSLLPTGEA